jgi:putative SOS response-associated peptidase YedK
MCGRFTLTTDLEPLEERFSFRTKDLSFKPRYNIAPSQSVLTVTGDDKGNRAGFLRWGLIPSWAKDADIGNRMINARAETVADKPSFRRALQKRRCLILADGFYEWRQEGKKKTPVFITFASREPFAFAGLWETWRPPDGEAIHSCTIITTTPNPLMESIHNRMPVILARKAEVAWLDRTITEPEKLLPFLVPYSDTLMDAYDVALIVNSPKNDSPACIAPVQ